MYTPSASDVGTVVTMTLSVGGVSTTECNGAIDEMTVTFDSQPTANAGSDQRICEDAGSITMAGVVGGGVTTGTWTTAGDGTFGDPSVLNTLYTPGAADIVAGSVVLTLTSADNGTCASATDAMTLMIDLLPTADAGLDQEVCGATAVTMAGVIGGGGDSLI